VVLKIERVLKPQRLILREPHGVLRRSMVLVIRNHRWSRSIHFAMIRHMLRWLTLTLGLEEGIDDFLLLPLLMSGVFFKVLQLRELHFNLV